jgi:hypothetical protein
MLQGTAVTELSAGPVLRPSPPRRSSRRLARGLRSIGHGPFTALMVKSVNSSVAGLLAGLALSPGTGLLSWIRQSRMFHPAGALCTAEVVPVAQAAPALDVAARLAGPALVRWSSAWWKHREWTDVLGCAIRFADLPFDVEPKSSDQDLLLATIQRPWTLPFAPLTTRIHDYLGNAYFGVSPFDVSSLGRIEWRLTPAAGAPSPRLSETRHERLTRAIETRTASLLLEWSPYPGPLTRPQADRFQPLVRITLTGFAALDQERLRFDPFRSGRGLNPVGFVHGMRRAAYWTSQALRPSHR